VANRQFCWTSKVSAGWAPFRIRTRLFFCSSIDILGGDRTAHCGGGGDEESTTVAVAVPGIAAFAPCDGRILCASAAGTTRLPRPLGGSTRVPEE